MEENQKEIAFRRWIAAISDEFSLRLKDENILHLADFEFKESLLDHADFEFTENLIIGRFHRTRYGQLAAGFAIYKKLILRDAGLALELFLEQDLLFEMPIGHRTELEVLQDHLPNGFRVEAFGGINLKIIAPSHAAAYQLWRNIGSIAHRQLIGYWLYLWIEHQGVLIVRSEPIAPLLRRFG
jgi:hypothetical protein